MDTVMNAPQGGSKGERGEGYQSLKPLSKFIEHVVGITTKVNVKGGQAPCLQKGGNDSLVVSFRCIETGWDREGLKVREVHHPCDDSTLT